MSGTDHTFWSSSSFLLLSNPLSLLLCHFQLCGRCANNEIRSDEKKTRGSKSAPCKSSEQEGSPNARERESREKNRRTHYEYDKITEN